MSYTRSQERILGVKMIGEGVIVDAVKSAIEEEFANTYEGSDIANRVLDILTWGDQV